MTQQDRKPFAAAMLVMGEAFNEPVSDVRIEAYFDALKDLDYAIVGRAMRESLQTAEFFPRPVHIRTAALGSTGDRAEMGWAALIDAVRRVGYMGYPQFEDPSVMNTINALWGTWSRLCETLPAEGPELIGWRKAFLSAYGTADRRVAVPTYTSLPPAVASRLREIAAAKDMSHGLRIVPATGDGAAE